MLENQSAAQGASVAEEVSLLDSIVEQSRVAKSDSERERAKDIIGELANQVLSGTVVVSDNLSATLDARVAELDRLISSQLSAIMHAPEFQKLESTWRGLNYLVKETQTGTMIKIKALNATKRDLVRDFKTAIDFDQSALFKKVYEEEFGTLAPNHQARRQELARRREFVEQKLKPLIDGRKPTLNKIRLYVFGFSRGAAEARVFCSWLEDALGKDMTLAGVKVSVDFLGIFDTVASVGFAQSFMIASGHGGWGNEEFLRIPGYVERTVHLISSHEIRGSFPLDKAESKNCLELAFPGVHTDVGGAYQPGDQGRGCRADGTPDDSMKMSQVTLAKMYREAVAAGVPLKPSTDLPTRVLDALKISPQLIKDYNDYVDAVNPLIRKHGGGTTGAARVQYGLYLRWRRLRLNAGAQAFENQPFFKRAQKFSAQCAQDLAGANEELREEAKIMAEMESSPVYSDGWMGKVFRNVPGPGGVVAEIQQFVWGEKVKQWREVKSYWNDTSPLDARIVKFFDDYVHDSRAWFKPTGATNEEVWKRRQRERLEDLKRKDAEWKAQWAEINAASARDPEGVRKRFAPVDEGGQGDIYPPLLVGQDRTDLDRYLKHGSLPLEKTGREFSSVWGYLRWRTHFAPTLPVRERAQAAWTKASQIPGKVADKITDKAKDVAHSAEEKAAEAAGKILEAGKESLIRGAKDMLDRFTGGGIPRL